MSQSSIEILHENHFSSNGNSNNNNNSSSIEYNIFATITSSGKCNEHKDKYAIYIIDVKKIYENSSKNEIWQTYRRFNDFHDLHLTIKKKVDRKYVFIFISNSTCCLSFQHYQILYYLAKV